MKLLGKILHRRLDKIRKELNFYIAENIQEKHFKTDMFMAEAFFKQEKSGTVTDKFLDCMYLNDHECEDYFDDEEEECQSNPEVDKPYPKKESVLDREKTVSAPQVKYMYSRPFQSAASTTQNSEIRIPDFWAKNEQKRTIDEMLEQKAETFSTMLLRLIDEKGLKDSEVYKRANIDRRLFSKIRGDEDYIPSKKTAISFCLALQLEMEEAKKLLECAGYALSNASRFDLIIMYLIEHKEYNIHFANIVLEDYGEGTLSK